MNEMRFCDATMKKNTTANNDDHKRTRILQADVLHILSCWTPFHIVGHDHSPHQNATTQTT